MRTEPRSGFGEVAHQLRASGLPIHGEGRGPFVERQADAAELGPAVSGLVRQAHRVPFGGRTLHQRLERLGRSRIGFLRELGEADEEAGMVGRAVIALAVVLDHELPVRLFNDRGLVGNLGAIGCVRCEIGRDRRLEAGQRRRLIAQTDIDQPRHHLDMDRGQMRAGRIEIGRHLPGVDQPSVQLVDPLMVRTDEPLRLAFVLQAQFRAAMPAGVVERPNLAVAVAQHDHRVRADIEGDIIAGLPDLGRVAGEDPIRLEDGLDVRLMQFRCEVELAREAVARSVLVEKSL